MKKNEKDIQYKIIKSEACGHSIQYRMIKKETELEKAKIDEGLSAKEKKKARKERSEEFVPHKKEKFHSEGYREYKTPQSQEKLKQKLKPKERPKLPSKEDLEYPMAASEEMEKCIDNPDCDCQEKKKKMKKSSNFYIQKIQELRKAVSSMAENTPKIPNSQLQRGIQNSVQANTPGAASGGNALADSMGMPSAQEMSKPLIPTAPKSLQTPDPRTNPSSDYGNPQTQKQMQDFYQQDTAQKADIKSASNNFIGNLASGKNTTTQNPAATSSIPMASPTANTPMANPSPNTPGLSPDAAKQAQAAANPAAAQQAANPAAANPTAANPTAAEKPKSFGEAFKAARDARIAGTGPDTFPWNGKTYHSFQKDDFDKGSGTKYQPGVVEQENYNRSQKGQAPMTPEQKSMNFPNLGMTEKQVQQQAPSTSVTPTQQTSTQMLTPKTGPTPSEGQLRDQGFNKNKTLPSGGPA